MVKIQIIELPSEFDMLPLRAAAAIRNAQVVILQSEQAESASEIRELNGQMLTLDDLFEQSEDFDMLYADGAERIKKAAEGGNTVFCVLGDVGSNGFVQELCKRGAQLSYISCGSAVAEALTAARQTFPIDGYEVLNARELSESVFDTSNTLVLTGIDNHYASEAVKNALSDYYPEDTEGILCAGGRAEKIRLYDMDRDISLGTGGIFVLPPTPLCEKERYGLYDLVRIMQVLRGENGCPWDKEQTHESLRQYILEEAYETVDAIDSKDIYGLYDELGDVFLQVVFHAEIGRQCGEFDIDDVATAVCRKMINRHPHIFGSVRADTARDVVTNWEAIKRREKKNKDFVSVLRDVPKSMGAMMRAYKLQKKASAIGFDWSNAAEAFLKVEEELAEWKQELDNGAQDAMEGEAGDLLFAVINVLRLERTNPELCLNRTCEKFIERMAFMETHAQKELSQLTLSELDELWEQAKPDKSV